MEHISSGPDFRLSTSWIGRSNSSSVMIDRCRSRATGRSERDLRLSFRGHATSRGQDRRAEKRFGMQLECSLMVK